MLSGARGGGRTLLQRAIAMLARREHSRVELGQKLRRFLAEGEDASSIESVLDQLEAKQMLSDARFAATLAGSRGARFGAQRIRHDLRKSGVSDELLQSTVDGLKHTELARAQAVWSKKFASPAGDAAGRARQMRFLAGRGFSTDVIRRVVRARRGDDEDGQMAE